MSNKLSRRQLIKGTAMTVAGVGIGGTSIESVEAAPPQPGEGVLLGVITNAAGSPGSVTVQLDSPPGGTSTTGASSNARPSIRYRSLSEGDRVAVTKDPEGNPIATPLFMTLSGPIQVWAGRELTVQGRRCFIDELSVVRDGSGERNLMESLRLKTPHVGQNVGVLCVANSRSGKLTVETLYLV